MQYRTLPHYVPREMPVFDGRGYRHREVTYSPSDLRKKRERVYILTDQPERVAAEFAAETDGVLLTLADLSDTEIGISAFYVHFSLHEKALVPLKRIVACKGLFAPPPMFDKIPFIEVSANAIHSINNAASILGHEPFGGQELHSQICQAIELTRHVRGDFVEIGVFSGSSALTALSHMDRLGIKRRSWLLDTYSGFTYETSMHSPDLIWGGTHIMDPEKTVARIQGLVAQTDQQVNVVPMDICADPLPAEIQQIAIANIDVDIYDAIAIALKKVAPLMARRGVIIVEDATALPGLYGAYLALEEFLESAIGRDFLAVRTTTQYFLIRID
ncbi:TylF/MycF/NovP-related O-methyltransferase [Rhizobium sp. BK376]|uniref:TylF/MycF/NovP-related O-methyltransferase n=1 Tax=Rhizobium sp. BK376 TaxID=2512149 RepID=UPI00104D28FB|nr:TylF/MycF/NovP-related O-methyltransferase [Rhizobium sp. BK376]TCR64518.1 macrocin-O-methyltransferase TylF [Rhizobium sp. BK376]